MSLPVSAGAATTRWRRRCQPPVSLARSGVAGADRRCRRISPVCYTGCVNTDAIDTYCLVTLLTECRAVGAGVFIPYRLSANWVGKRVDTVSTLCRRSVSITSK